MPDTETPFDKTSFGCWIAVAVLGTMALFVVCERTYSNWNRESAATKEVLRLLQPNGDWRDLSDAERAERIAYLVKSKAGCR